MKCELLMMIVAAAMITATAQQTKAPLKLTGSTDLPDISGDMDHLAIDATGERLFVAAEDNGTLRVIDLKTGELQRTVRGFHTPHSILVVPGAKELYITDGSDAVLVLDSDTFQVKRRVKTTPGADSIGVDQQKHLLFAVSGGKDVSMKTSEISEINFAEAKLVREIPINAAHVEAMALENPGSRLFVNVTDKNYLAVVDRESGKMLAQWPITEAEQNAPLAFDQRDQRLFVVCRKPSKLVVLDSTNGRSVASFPTGERADEAVFDSVHRRIYVAAGEGNIYSYQQEDADHYDPPVKVASAPGAKTAILSSDARTFFVAVSPGEGKTGARVLVYGVN